MNPEVDKFLSRSKQWHEEAAALRAVILKAKLQEHLKWRLPCYTHDDRNIAIIQPFKACLALMFFKGALLKDSKKLLVNNGPNSQSSKRLELHSVQEINQLSSTIKAYLQEAIAIEDSGQEVRLKRKPEPLPTELKKMLAQDPKLKTAFTALTPGRQRAYILYFSGAKQPATRQSRIEKYVPRILAGKGMMD